MGVGSQELLDPFAVLLGLQIEEVRPDFCRMRLPFRPEVRTAGEVVHGGAISTLIDSAGVVAAWSNVMSSPTRGATANLSVSFLAAAQAVDLFAEARVIRRGRSMVFVDIDVTTQAGEAIAKGLLTYKLGYG
jgi:uncharacterized protein (TIGR00369 family)